MTTLNNSLKLFSIIICLFIAVNTFAQETTVKGKIIDKTTKEGLIGANVQIKGTTIGAVTDMNGDFELTAEIKFPAKITITYLGYAEQEIEISDARQKINISMLPQEVRVSNDVVISASN